MNNGPISSPGTTGANSFTIMPVTRRVGLAYYVDPDGNPMNDTHGFNREEFHYCPRGPWSDWVKLAEWILKEDKRRRERAAEREFYGWVA